MREASKRGQQWIGEAQRLLAERRKTVETRLTATRERLQKVQSAADAKASAARAQYAEFQAAVAAAGQQRAAVVGGHAEALHKALRAARRAWVRSGKIDRAAARRHRRV